MKIMYLDLETTGVNPKNCGIIQIAGIISIDGAEEEFEILLNPGNVEYEPGAEERHTRSRAEIINFQSSVEAFIQFKKILAKHVNPYDRSDKYYLVGYNVNFDLEFLRAWFKSHNDEYIGSWFWYPALDVLNFAAFKLIGKHHLIANLKQATLYQYLFNEELLEAHNAIADIRATRRILNKLITS